MPVPERAGEAAAGSLAGVSVILTRPRHQCRRLIAMLSARGAEARCLPVVEIEPPPDAAPAKAALSDLSRFHTAIFASVNAVHGALALCPDLGPPPAALGVAAVGPATRRALENAGIAVAIAPHGEAGSEGLLAHPGLAPEAVRGRRVLIVKGAGGRGLLEERLEAAGATVTAVDVYRRSRPGGRIPELLGGALSKFDLLVLTSGTALEHLLELASPEETRRVLDMPLVVPSERIAQIATRYGARRRPLLASGAGDAALVEAIERWRRRP